MSHGIDFLDVLLIASFPIFLMGLYGAWLTWRDDHPPRRRERHHAAE